ncbi:MAG: DNA primase [Phycisphaerales bacterium]
MSSTKFQRGGFNDDVSKVKDACDIVRIIGESVAVKPKGREYVCLCPFHDDHNPSMRVIPAKQIFHCFVCGTGGDVFSFVKKFHKMEFREALEFLAEKVGVTLTPWRRSGEQEASGVAAGLTKRQVLDAAGVASKFFRTILNHPEHGATARATIARRGVTAEMVDRFELGAAPDRFDGLLKYAQRHGLSIDALREAGLFKLRESDQSPYDLLRHRLIFPIHDRTGRVVAFGGRKLRDEDEPKYINSPETRLFNKSSTLYAMHLASRSIQKERTALVTEGYMDALACHQGGFTHAVATLGTALTLEHAAQLRQLCDRVVLLFDGDDAGQRAADRTVSIFFAEPIDVRIATLSAFTDAKDPDELLKREGGAEVFRTVIERSTDLLDYRFARLRRQLEGKGDAALSRAINEELASMVEMGLHEVEPVRQKLIIRRLADLAGVDEATIRRVVPAGRTARVYAPREQAESGEMGASGEAGELAIDATFNAGTWKMGVLEHLMGCLLCEGSLWGTMGDLEKNAVAPANLAHPVLQALAQVIMDLGEDGDEPSLERVLARAEKDSTRAAATIFASRVDEETGHAAAKLAEHWEQLQRSLRQGAAGAVLAEPKMSAGGGSIAERLQAMQKRHREDGPNRRVLPGRD